MLTSTALNTRRQQRGITLIEVSIGLIIAAIIAAAAFIAFQNNARRTETQDNIKQITEVVAETKQKFGLTGPYTVGSLLTAAEQVGIFETTTPANSYGGNIGLNGVDANNAELIWPNVEEDQCIDIVLNIADGATSIEGNAAADVWTSSTGPIDLAAAQTVCANAVAPVTLTYTFGRR